jgi:hypothetical protein
MEKCNSIDVVASDCDCCHQQPTPPFAVYHNGVDRASVINLKDEDVTEYFNISIEYGIFKIDFKEPPTTEEWFKIAGK